MVASQWLKEVVYDRCDYDKTPYMMCNICSHTFWSQNKSKWK